jgi:hypothetical protein
MLLAVLQEETANQAATSIMWFLLAACLITKSIKVACHRLTKVTVSFQAILIH